jgi:hypothetical protein
MILFKVNSVQEACAKCFAVQILKFEILQTTQKNKWKCIKMQDLLIKNKNKSLMSFVSFFSCDAQDFNHRAFGASFLYWVDFTGVMKSPEKILNSRGFDLHCDIWVEMKLKVSIYQMESFVNFNILFFKSE